MAVDLALFGNYNQIKVVSLYQIVVWILCLPVFRRQSVLNGSCCNSRGAATSRSLRGRKSGWAAPGPRRSAS